MCHLKIKDVCVKIIHFICCKRLKSGYTYVKYETDDMTLHKNIMFDMKHIKFAPSICDEREWTNCELYDEQIDTKHF